MKKSTVYEGSIKLIVKEENGVKTPSVEIEFKDTGEDSLLLIPALYDLLKYQHERYSMINIFRKI